MKVEQLEPTEDEIIDLAARNEQKAIMSGEDSLPTVGTLPKEPETQTAEADITDQENDQEPEKSEPTIQEQIQAQAALIDKLQRALDKTNGTYGNELNHLKRKLAEVESKKRDVFKSISPAQLKRVTAAYPELANDLAEDLNDAFSVSKEAQEDPVIDQPKSDPRIDSLNESTGKLAEQVKQMALSELSRIHPDWHDVAHWDTENIPGVGDVIKFDNPAFGYWVNKQDQDIKDVVFASEDIAAISQVITKFKSESSKEPYAPKPKPTINKKLEKALLPTGRRTGSHELLSEDEIILQAQLEEQKRIMNGY